MGYCLEREEPVGTGLKRIAREELVPRGGQNPDEAIHEARKSVKKTRAILRLIRTASGPVYSRENDALRGAGRMLSALRDSAALMETLDFLNAKGLHSIRASLLKRKQAAAAPAAALRQALATLRRVAKRVPSWPAAGEGFAAIEQGLEQTYRRGRKALAVARRDEEPEAWHSLRKRVKDHWYQIRLLENISGPGMQTRRKRLKQLETSLGVSHNLAVLRAAIAADPAIGSAEDVALARKLIDGAETKLHRDSLRIAGKLYDEKPRDFMRRMKHGLRIS